MSKTPRGLTELLAQSDWTADLAPADLARIVRETVIRPVAAGAFVCRKGEPVESWIGVADGLVKIASVSTQGKSVTFTGVPAGGWLGEGSLLKREPRRYDVVAIRDSRIAFVPRATFDRLLATSIGFNGFLLRQLNERLGQFIAMVEYERLLNPHARVARCVSQLFNPMLYPGQGRRLEISQHEIGYLTGLSRQRVNQALRTLEQAGMVSVEYGAITILDPLRLASYEG